MIVTPKPCTLLLYLGLSLPLAMQTLADERPFRVRVIDQNLQPVNDAIVINTEISATAAPNVIAIMDQQDKKFQPHVLAITRGQKVTFPNSDNIRHHVYSFSDAKRFEIKLYANTPEAPIEFERGGIVVLGCNIHDKMIGYIFVSDWQHFVQTDAQGIAQFNALDVAPKSLAIWHPELADPTRLQTLEAVSLDSTGTATITIQRQTLTVPIPNNRFRP